MATRRGTGAQDAVRRDAVRVVWTVWNIEPTTIRYWMSMSVSVSQKTR